MIQDDIMTVEEHKLLINMLEEKGFKIYKFPVKSTDNCRWDCNNDITIVVTELSVFIREGCENEDCLHIISKLCTRGRSELVTTWIADLMKKTKSLPVKCSGPPSPQQIYFS
jgi:hypothetical protein